VENKNVIIAASGTGGHIYPGISLAKEFRDNGYQVMFFISNNEASENIMKNSGFDFVTFNLSGMPRGFSIRFVSFFFKLIFSFFKSLKLISKIKPAAVIGTGGYISVPPVFAAKILKIKTFIHEQNVFPGVANKLLNRIADITFVSFKDSEKYFKRKKIFFSGYPVRKDISGISKFDVCRKFNFENDIFTILIFGGSLGAAKINEIAFDAVKELSLKEKTQTLHITGQKNHDYIRSKNCNEASYKIFDYMHDIRDAYAASDIVICRAGAGTVFELKMLKKSAVLIPYPSASDNHQFYNAKEIEKDGVVEIIDEKNLSVSALVSLIEKLKSNQNKQIVSNSECSQAKLPIESFPQEIIFGEIKKCIES